MRLSGRVLCLLVLLLRRSGLARRVARTSGQPGAGVQLAAHRRRQAEPAGDLAGPEQGGLRPAGSCREARHAGGQERRRRRRDSVSALGGGEEGGEFREPADRRSAGECFMPGVPRIMYMDFPFQIFQTRDHVAMTFEWSQVYRLIYTNGKPAASRASISGWAIRAAAGKATRSWSTSPTTTTNLVRHGRELSQRRVAVGRALHAARRRHIQYEVTIEDPKVFTRPWKISMPLHRQKDMDRILEYQCQAEAEEANGAVRARTAYLVSEPGNLRSERRANE